MNLFRDKLHLSANLSLHLSTDLSRNLFGICA